MSVFADPTVQDILRDFIPVAESCAYTSKPSRQDERYQFFWDAVFSVPPEKVDAYSKNNYRGPMGIWLAEWHAGRPEGRWGPADVDKSDFNPQGHWVIDAAGKAYGYSNSRSNNVNETTPSRPLIALLLAAKRDFDLDPPARLALSAAGPNPKPAPPAGAVVARSYHRVTPLPEGAGAAIGRVGRDHLWITRAEIEMLARGIAPDDLTGRLLRYHLRNITFNLGAVWRPQNIRRARFEAEAETSGDEILVRIRGFFSMLSPEDPEDPIARPERGYEGMLDGELVLARKDLRVVRLDFLAEGEAWGGLRNTIEYVPSGRYPLKVAFVLATDQKAREVPPEGVVAVGLKNYLAPGLPSGL